MISEFTVNILCSIFDPNQKQLLYRLYIDNDLLIERQWLWGNSCYIRENIAIETQDNALHTVKLVPLYRTPNLRNILGNTNPVPFQSSESEYIMLTNLMNTKFKSIFTNGDLAVSFVV